MVAVAPLSATPPKAENREATDGHPTGPSVAPMVARRLVRVACTAARSVATAAVVVVAAASLATGCTGIGGGDQSVVPRSSLRPPVPDTLPSTENSVTLTRIAATGKVRIGVKFDVPLFGLKDPTTGVLSGFDVEISKIIARALFAGDTDAAARIVFIEALSKNRERLLTDGTVDLVVSTYTINDARKQFVDFAGPYYVAGQDILAKRTDIESGRLRGVGDVGGKKVCSVTGSTSLANLRAASPTADTGITKDKYSECFEALKEGSIDAMTTDDVILLGLAQGFPEFALTGNPFHTEPYGIGISKGDAEMRTFVNSVLQKAFDDGRWQAAFAATVGTTGAIAPTPPVLDR
jgi:glutamate transport system substrate-binding protein